MDEYEIAVVDLEYVEGAPDFVSNASLVIKSPKRYLFVRLLRGIYNTGLYNIEMRARYVSWQNIINKKITNS